MDLANSRMFCAIGVQPSASEKQALTFGTMILPDTWSTQTTRVNAQINKHGPILIKLY